ncbi:MAG: hypothetical protein FWE23_09150 [Chitinivibrionia bacterium]|nr:hypothetical protein [Chitinivibrionia bacterium]
MGKLGIAILMALVAFATIGCAGAHTGSSVLGLHQTNVKLDGTREFRYVQQGVAARGQSVYVLGIGGMRTPRGIIGQARENLSKQYVLQPNQAMINVTHENHTASIFGLFLRVRHIITADIIEFIDVAE